MTEFSRPTYTEEEIAKTVKVVCKYVEENKKDGYYPSDVAEALDIDFWLIQDAFTKLAEEGYFEQPKFEPGFCPHPSFAIVVNQGENKTYSLYCYGCREELPFFFYTEAEWKELGDR